MSGAIKSHYFRRKESLEANRRHDVIAENLRDRLVSTGRYDEVNLDLEYISNGHQGQVDVEARIGDIYHFYETKLHYTKPRKNKAHNQFKRYCMAHPDREVKGILVAGGYDTKQVVKRLWIKD